MAKAGLPLAGRVVKDVAQHISKKMGHLFGKLRDLEVDGDDEDEDDDYGPQYGGNVRCFSSTAVSSRLTRAVLRLQGHVVADTHQPGQGFDHDTAAWKTFIEKSGRKRG